MLNNNQNPEKVIESDGSILEVHSIFKTIQGEGPFSGTPAIFIRLAGCNLQCQNCDTDYTSSRRFMESVGSITDSINVLAEQSIKLVVITGGEPFRQNIKPLITELINSKFYVQIETNGTIEPPLELVYNHNITQRHGLYVVCSPKTPTINRYYHKISCAFKYVLNHNSVSDDGLPFSVLGVGLSKQVARPNDYFQGLIYLQPEDSYDEEINVRNQKAVVKSCLEHNYILNLQIHKLLGVE
jgi:7-carboxy-7-deazaguanine synthase